MKNLYIITICTLLSLVANVQLSAQEESKVWQWINSLGGEGWDISSGISITDNDQIYIAGGFTQNLEGSNNSIESNGNRDIYVARYTTKGKLQWLWQAGGAEMDKITTITAAPDNDLYISGILSGEMKFGNKQITGDGKKVFIARINKRGKSEWIYTLPYTGTASAYLLQNGTDEALYVGGTFSDQIKNNSDTIISKGYTDVFLLHLDQDGNQLGFQQIGQDGREELTALTSDNSNNIYLSINYDRTFSYNTLTFRTENNELNQNTVLLKLNNKFEAVRYREFSSPIYIQLSGMISNENNQLLITGNYNESFATDSLVATSNGQKDFFVAQLDTSLNIRYLKSFGGIFSDYTTGIQQNKLGGAMISGSFNDSLMMDSIVVFSTSNQSDAFVAQFDKRGNVTWVGTLESENNTITAGTCLDRDGNLYITGSFADSIAAGLMQAITLGEEDIYLAKCYNCPDIEKAIYGPTLLCEGSEIELYVDSKYQNIVWNDSLATGRSFVVNNSGVYWVEMVDKKGCVVRDTVIVEEIRSKTFSIGNDTSLLINSTIELSGPNDAIDYLWQDGSTNYNFLASDDGESGTYQYSLTITDSLGCQWSDDIRIEFYNLPNLADLSKGEDLINIYPNPVSSILNWKFETNIDVCMEIEILDINGRVILNETIERYLPGDVKKIDTSRLTSGSYYLVVIGEVGTVAKKFVKE